MSLPSPSSPEGFGNLLPPQNAFVLGTDGLSPKPNFSHYPMAENIVFACKDCKSYASGITLVMPLEIFFECCCDNQGCTVKKWLVCSICAYVNGGENGQYATTKKSFIKKHVTSATHKKSQKDLLLTLVDNQKIVIEDSSSLLQNSTLKRKEDSSKELRKVLGAHFGGSIQMEMLWCELGKQVSGTQHLVLSSSFPTDHCKTNDTAVAEDMVADFLAAKTYFRMSKGTRKSVVEMCHYYYELGGRHKKEDIDWEKQVMDDARSMRHSKGDEDTAHDQSTYLLLGNQISLAENKSSTNMRRILPACNLKDIDNRYLSSKHSITQNLPIPPVSKRRANHATTSLVGCLKDILSNGTPFDPVPFEQPQDQSTVSWITETPMASKMRDMAGCCFGEHNTNPSLPRLIMPYIVWRDDFESNNSTKTKGSTWCQTVTIAPSKRQHNLLQQTYPLAVARSNEKHADAEEYLLKKIHLLMGAPMEMFSFVHGETVAVVAMPYAFICDQPERRKATQTMAGNSIYHARFRFSINHKALLPVLRTCCECLTSMRMGSLRNQCENCANWDVETHLVPGHGILSSKLKLSPPPTIQKQIFKFVVRISKTIT
jgi:hypothetical protein